jgi:glycosyltransferase involved in cell wall biosynthesis
VKSHLPRLRFVYLTQQDREEVVRAALAAGLERDDVLVTGVSPLDVPRWLTLFRLGVFFLRPSYAAKASSFTKLGEFLGAGVPVITNTGVGDVDRILGSERAGLLVQGLTDRDLAVAARKALPLLEGESVPPETARACREIAAAHFALADGARRYRAIYRSLGLDDVADSPVAAEVT